VIGTLRRIPDYAANHPKEYQNAGIWKHLLHWSPGIACHPKLPRQTLICLLYGTLAQKDVTQIGRRSVEPDPRVVR